MPHFKLSFIRMELLFFPARFPTLLLLLSFSISFFLDSPARADDPEALLALKSSIDPSNALPWPQGADFCRWQGVRGCLGGRVTKLVIEFRNLSGGLEGKSLNQLNQLRVLSFKSNSLAGAIPDISGLTNLKSLYLSDNRFSGDFPASIASLHRLKVVVLSSNRISGRIPATLLSLVRLYTLFLQDNKLTGEIPPLNQSSLRYFNVSGNRLSGRIPSTSALVRFNLSSFSGNRELCGEQVARPCSGSTSPPPAPTLSPGGPAMARPNEKKKKTKLAIILAASIGGSLLVLAFAVAFATALLRFTRRRRRSAAAVAVGAGVEKAEEGDGQAKIVPPPPPAGQLVWCGGVEQGYSVEDLLRASAETLGRGTTGSTYKAVMESGFIVTVKRLKEAAGVGIEEFGRQVEELGRLRHPNLVSLRAFFQAKDERLLVYDYFPNGNLFSLVHGINYVSPF